MAVSNTALVLSGGGARGAYEAGVLHYLRTMLPKPHCGIAFDVLCGTSVGAINAAFVASTAHDPFEQGRRARALWQEVDQDRIFKRDWFEIAKFLGRGSLGLARNFLSFNPSSHQRHTGRHWTALFDTKPLPQYLWSVINFRTLGQNIRAGRVKALALAATSLTTDAPVLFVQKHRTTDYRGSHVWVETRIGIRHVMASAAIPFVFPAVKIGATYYCDGSVRLNTPVGPAIHLGADRMIVIGTAPATWVVPPPPLHPDEPPSMGRMMAAVMDAVFQDRARYDLEQLQRINRIIEWGERTFGPDFLDRVNAMLAAENVRGDIADRGLRKVEVLAIHPSRDLAAVFRDHLRKNPYLDESFSTFERFSMRLFGMSPQEGPELFSYLVFSRKYIGDLLELGYEDARAQRDDLMAFIERALQAASVPQRARVREPSAPA